MKQNFESVPQAFKITYKSRSTGNAGVLKEKYEQLEDAKRSLKGLQEGEFYDKDKHYNMDGSSVDRDLEYGLVEIVDGHQVAVEE